MRASSILLVEPNHGGHFLMYVRLLASYALARGHEVNLALSADAIASTEFDTHLGPIQADVRIWVTSSRPRMREIRAIARRSGAERTVVPNADPLLPGFALTPWRRRGLLVLLMMSDPSWDRSTGLKRRLRRRAKAGTVLVLSRRNNVRLVRLTAPGCASRDGSYSAQDPVIVESATDEINSSAKRLRRDLELVDDVFWFGIVGVITPWKNVDLVVKALRIASGRSSAPLGLALIGPLHEQYQGQPDRWQEMATRAGVRFVARNQVMTNEEMNAAVSAVDCVVVAYSTNAPNSTLGKAAALGVRLVSAGSSSIREFTGSLGYVLHSELEPAELADALIAAVHSPRPRPRTDLGADQMCRSLLVETGDGKRRGHGAGAG